RDRRRCQQAAADQRGPTRRNQVPVHGHLDESSNQRVYSMTRMVAHGMSAASALGVGRPSSSGIMVSSLPRASIEWILPSLSTTKTVGIELMPQKVENGLFQPPPW